MASIHLFNPENDFALALGRRSFTPDKGAVAIRRAGQLLPLWWAEEDDLILVDTLEAETEARRLKERYHLRGELVTTAPQPILTPEPWGWSHYTRRQFINAGISEESLPTDEYLDSLRSLSHRRTAIEVNRLTGTPVSLMPVEAATFEEAIDAVESRRGDAVIKLPWSSSGRGVIYAGEIPRPTLETYIKGMIRRQGSVTIEPRYRRLRDFAMLFHSDGAGISYRGLSTFATDNRGFYAGNIVASQAEIAKIIGLDTRHLIEPLAEALCTVARPIGYRGWIGVDMLVYSASDGSERIAPCIEVNFRRTMGVAALYVARHLPDAPGLINSRF